MSTTKTPAVIDRFLQATEAADWAAFAACFLPHGVVLDEGRTFVGRDEIRARRQATADAVTFTATVVARGASGRDGFKLVQHLEGDFPGGVVDLDFLFALRDDQIAALMVLPHAG